MCAYLALGKGKEVGAEDLMNKHGTNSVLVKIKQMVKQLQNPLVCFGFYRGFKVCTCEKGRRNWSGMRLLEHRQ
jgi:hypothetical protein